MLRHLRPFSPLIVMLLLAACGGGSGGGAVGRAPADERGAVALLFDTRAGDDALVQARVAGVAFEQVDGSIGATVPVDGDALVLGDPSGELDGLHLRAVPPGIYRALHLVLLQNSGVCLGADGLAHPVRLPTAIRVGLPEALQHGADKRNWIVIGHDAPPLRPQPDGLAYEPSMSARTGADEIELSELNDVLPDGAGLRGLVPQLDLATIDVAPDAQCAFEGADGATVADLLTWLADARPDDVVRVRGRLSRDGRMRARYLQRRRKASGPRLIGRVAELDDATLSFEMLVQATNGGGQHAMQAVPARIRVLTDGATLRAPNGDARTFSDLVVEGLVKVRWSAREAVAGDLDEYTAREVTIVGGDDDSVTPQWSGLVDGVDLDDGVITVVPRNDDPLVVDGAVVDVLTVTVDDDTAFARKPQGGGPWQPSSLADIVAGQDRIWVRGVVTGPAEVAADRVRVRAD